MIVVGCGPGRCPDTPAGKFDRDAPRHHEQHDNWEGQPALGGVAAAGDTDQLLAVGVSVGSDAMLPAGPG
jgi:hypothetical protein